MLNTEAPLLLIFASCAALGAVPAWAAAGDFCTPDVVDAAGNVTQENFTDSCEDGTENLLVCNPSVQQVVRLDCSAIYVGAPVGRCQEFAGVATCAFADGDPCVFSTESEPIFPLACQDPTSGCMEGFCTPDAGTCRPDAEAACAGASIVTCLNTGQNLVLSCDAIVAANGASATGLACADSGDGLYCEGAQIGDSCVDGFLACADGGMCDSDTDSDTDFGQCVPASCGSSGAGVCDNGVAIVCTDQLETERNDCATFGQICVQSDSGGPPRCVVGDPTCGPLGLGACDLSEATICERGEVVTVTDCSTVGRVCGAVAGTGGRIGCVVPGGEGEGEGEGSACSDNEDCGSGEFCGDDDTCQPTRGSRRTEAEPPPPPAFSLSCTSQRSPAFFVTLLGLGLWTRRRRAGVVNSIRWRRDESNHPHDSTRPQKAELKSHPSGANSP